jgi:hypothetical protein
MDPRMLSMTEAVTAEPQVQSRRPRHSLHRCCRDFNETNEGAKGHGFVLFSVPFFPIAMKSDEAICSVPALAVRVRIR